MGEQGREGLGCTERDLIISWSWRTSERRDSNSAEVEGGGGARSTAATNGTETSMAWSAISARFSRLITSPEGIGPSAHY